MKEGKLAVSMDGKIGNLISDKVSVPTTKTKAMQTQRAAIR
jgi:hypothetical protein